MSAHDHDFPKTTVSQVVLALLGGLFAPLLVGFLIFKLVTGYQAEHIAADDAAAQAAQVEERIKPVGEVSVGAAPAAAGGKSGEQVAQSVCIACHGTGAMGSPKIGDNAAWGPRIGQGFDTLVKHAIEGIRMMPARGGSPNLSDTEVAAAVAYMANQSGASFEEPTAAAPAAAPADAAAPAADAAAAPAPAAAGKSGEQVVQASCAACHGAGVMGAPKIGDKAAWGPRIGQGFDTLVKHAKEGIRMMPARGGNPALTDVEVARAVAHMANQSGADFAAP